LLFYLIDIQLNKRATKKVVANNNITTGTSPISVRFTDAELTICANKLSELRNYCELHRERGKKASRIELIRAAIKLLDETPMEVIYSAYNDMNNERQKKPSRNEIVRVAVKLLDDTNVEKIYNAL